MIATTVADLPQWAFINLVVLDVIVGFLVLGWVRR